MYEKNNGEIKLRNLTYSVLHKCNSLSGAWNHSWHQLGFASSCCHLEPASCCCGELHPLRQCDADPSWHGPGHQGQVGPSYRCQERFVGGWWDSGGTTDHLLGACSSLSESYNTTQGVLLLDTGSREGLAKINNKNKYLFILKGHLY